MKFLVLFASFALLQAAEVRVGVNTPQLNKEDGDTLYLKPLLGQMEVLGDAPRYPSSRITNGVEAQRGQLPYQVGISIDRAYWCGGSLLNQQWVLTAAHCCEGASAFVCYLGAKQLNVSETGRVLINAKTYYIHENYSSNTLNNDICVIKLDTPATYSTFIQPIRLVSKANRYNSFTNTTVRASGWGKTSDNSTSISQILYYVDQVVISNSQCQATYGTSVIQPSNICTNVVSGRSTCNGDSGGPLAIYSSPTTATQIGIVSFVSSRGCTSGDPDGFCRVGYYLNWIEQKTGMVLQ